MSKSRKVVRPKTASKKGEGGTQGGKGVAGEYEVTVSVLLGVLFLSGLDSSGVEEEPSAELDQIEERNIKL